MRNLVILLLVCFLLPEVQAQDSFLAYTVPEGPTYGVSAENSELYFLTSHDCHILSVDCENQTTGVLEILSFDESIYLLDLYLTEDWMWFSTSGSQRSIRRLNRNIQNAELEMVANNLFYPTALVATQEAVYYAEDKSIYKITLDNLSDEPELIIENDGLDFVFHSDAKMVLLNGNIYVSSKDALFEINTSNDEVEIISMPGLEITPSLVAIGDDKLLGRSYDELYLINLDENSFSFLGQIDCSASDCACLESDIALIDNCLFLSSAECPDLVSFTLPTFIFADVDGDGFGDPNSTVELLGGDYSGNYVFNSNDCDDENQSINPNVEDTPNNGIDEDCDGMDLLVASIEHMAETTFSVFPNPATDEINIGIEGQVNFKANLYDLEGKLVSTLKSGSTMPISSIPAGSYLLEIIDRHSAQKAFERIVIEH